MAECPECAGNVAIRPNTMAGEIMQCADCGSRLEIRSIQPLQIDRAPQIQEDWGE